MVTSDGDLRGDGETKTGPCILSGAQESPPDPSAASGHRCPLEVSVQTLPEHRPLSSPGGHRFPTVPGQQDKVASSPHPTPPLIIRSCRDSRSPI